jgi:hypothetical protein
MEDAVERIKEIMKRTQEFRDKLWDEELDENKIPRHVSWKEMDKNTVVVRVNDRKLKKKYTIFKESDFEDPFLRKETYVLVKEEQLSKACAS